MSFSSHAEVDLEPEERYGQTMTLGTERRSRQTVLVFDGPVGLETVIRFTELTVGRNSVEFYSRSRSRGGGRTKTGQIAGQQNVVDFLVNAVEEHPDLDYDVVVDR